MQDTCKPEIIDEILSNVGWAIYSTYVPYHAWFSARLSCFLGEMCYLISHT